MLGWAARFRKGLRSEERNVYPLGLNFKPFRVGNLGHHAPPLLFCGFDFVEFVGCLREINSA